MPIYLLCLVTQHTGNLELGRTQPSRGAGNRKPVRELFFGSRGRERVTLGLSSAKQPFPGAAARDEVRPSQNRSVKVGGEGRIVPCPGWGESVRLSVHLSCRWGCL